MLFDWGKAEAVSGRFAAWGRSDIIAKLKSGAQLSVQDRAALVAAIRQVRQPLLDFFFNHATTWLEADIPVKAVGAIHANRHFENETTIAEVADRRPEYHIADFAISRMLGRPIVVGPSERGPWCLLEGTHRCCEIVKAGDLPQPKSIPVIAGVCEGVSGWRFWR